MIQQAGRGGAQKRLLDLVSNFDPERIRPTVLVLETGGALVDALREIGADVRSVPRGASRLRRVLKRFREIRITARALRPEIVHAFDGLSGVYCRLALRSHTIVVGFNTCRVEVPLLRVAERLLQGSAAVVLANSEAGARYLRERCQVSGEKIRVLSQGLDLARMERPPADLPSLRQLLGLPESTLLVGLIGKLTEDKDPATFLDAAALAAKRCPEARFCIVGDGPLREAMAGRIADAGLSERFFLVSELPGGPWLSRELDVGVLTSRVEGLPNVVLEYMYWSKPVVVTAAGDSGRVVVDGVTGRVVSIGDAIGVAEALESLLADAGTREALGRAGRARLEEHYDMRPYVGEIERLYAGCAAPEQEPGPCAESAA